VTPGVRNVGYNRLYTIKLHNSLSISQISNLSILDEMLKLAVTVNSLDDFKQALELATSK